MAVTARHALRAVDRHGQLEPLAGELGQAALQTVPLRAARRVVADRLVARLGNGEDGIHRRLQNDLDCGGEIRPPCRPSPGVARGTGGYRLHSGGTSSHVRVSVCPADRRRVHWGVDVRRALKRNGHEHRTPHRRGESKASAPELAAPNPTRLHRHRRPVVARRVRRLGPGRAAARPFRVPGSASGCRHRTRRRRAGRISPADAYPRAAARRRRLLLVLLALAWLGATLWVLQREISTSVTDAVAVASAAISLPTVVSAGLVAGAAAAPRRGQPRPPAGPAGPRRLARWAGGARRSHRRRRARRARRRSPGTRHRERRAGRHRRGCRDRRRRLAGMPRRRWWPRSRRVAGGVRGAVRASTSSGRRCSLSARGAAGLASTVVSGLVAGLVPYVYLRRVTRRGPPGAARRAGRSDGRPAPAWASRCWSPRWSPGSAARRCSTRSA